MTSVPLDSPDGRRTAYVVGRELFVSSADGSGARDLGRAGVFSWSPDSRSLIVTPFFDAGASIVDVATGARRELADAFAASWSPDGARLAFSWSGGIWTMRADGSERRRLLDGLVGDAGASEAATWSPDGRWIAATTRTTAYSGYTPLDGVVAVELATGKVVRFPGYARRLSWSPAGKLLFVRVASLGAPKEVVLADPATGGEDVLARVPAGRACEHRGSGRSLPFGAAFSPAADRIAFAWAGAVDGACQSVVATMAPDGSDRRIVDREPVGTAPGIADWEWLAFSGPRWRADGKHLVVALERHTRRTELYARTLDGRRVLRLTRSIAAERDPAYSPDGRRIAFVTGAPEGDGTIVVARADGRHPRRVATGESPTWSPDGRRLAFDRGGRLFALDLATGAQRGLSRIPAAMPAWSPSGGVVAFVRRPVNTDEEPVLRSGGIELLDLRKGTARRVAADGFAPSWSPDGKLFAYTYWVDDDSSGDEEIYPEILGLTAAGTRADLGGEISSMQDAVFAPDGARLLGVDLFSGLAIVNPHAQTGARPQLESLPQPLGISDFAEDPDWQALR